MHNSLRRLLCALTVLSLALLPGHAVEAFKTDAYTSDQTAEPTGPAHVQTIVVDAGHGGKDNGTVGATRLKEKDVTLVLAHRLRRRLIDDGFTVIMTREDDRYLSLQERADVVAATHPDFFVSIHANAASSTLARGYETFYLSDPDNDAFDPERPFGERDYHYGNFFEEQQEMGKMYVNLLDRASGERRYKSIVLAELIHDAMKLHLRSRDRGVKRGKFFVLKNTNTPAVLIEVGFLSNPKEETLLRSPSYQGKIVKGIAGGLASYRRHQNANKIAHP